MYLFSGYGSFIYPTSNIYRSALLLVVGGVGGDKEMRNYREEMKDK